VLETKKSNLFHSGAVIEHHGGAADLLHVWFEVDRPGQKLKGQIVVDHRDLTEESEGLAEERMANKGRYGPISVVRLQIQHIIPCYGNCLRRYRPVFGLEAVHAVVVHGVEFILSNPVEEVDGQQLEEDVDEARDVLHVEGNAVVGNLADDPGAASSAHVNLSSESDWLDASQKGGDEKRAVRERLHPTSCANLLLSTAMSPPELPMPITTTRFPAMSSGPL